MKESFRNNIRNIEGAQNVTNWDGERAILLDGLAVPPCGTIIIGAGVDSRVDLSEHTCCATSTESGVVLHTDSYELVLNEQGEISRLYDKRAAHDVLLPGQTGNQLIAYEDRPLNFDAWDFNEIHHFFLK